MNVNFGLAALSCDTLYKTNNINHLVKVHRVVRVHLLRKLKTRCPIVAELSLGDI